tara:strand:- start:2730 stop:3191 length:462 start_codon:yes stop_codon:yes gene_type:complete
MLRKYKITPKINARRGSNNNVSRILEILYELYPKSLTVKVISRELNLSVANINKSVEQIKKFGVPIEHHKKGNITHLKANITEPIFWIIKEKVAAEKMLKLIKEIKFNGDDFVNNQKKINIRIYDEYLNNLNDLFDKWDSLRLIDKLERSSNI